MIDRDEFIEYYDVYPIFRFVLADTEGQMLTYQYSNRDKNHFDVVADLLTYRGQDSQGFHYWIATINLSVRPPHAEPFQVDPKSDQLKPGNIIKMKYRGMKQKFLVLGLHDEITENCIQKKVLDNEPLCYEETLSQFNTTGAWFPAASIGEFVIDDHTARIYLKRLSF
jgi:hypothetical protein